MRIGQHGSHLAQTPLARRAALFGQVFAVANGLRLHVLVAHGAALPLIPVKLRSVGPANHRQQLLDQV